MVGVKGLEPSTPWSQTRCATRLRYTPKFPISKQSMYEIGVQLYAKVSILSRFFCNLYFFFKIGFLVSLKNGKYSSV